MKKTRSLSCKSLLLGTDEETLWWEETAINFPIPSFEISITEAMNVTTTLDVYCLPKEKLKRNQPEFTSRKWNCSAMRFFSASYWLLKEIAEREVEIDRDRMRERQRETEGEREQKGVIWRQPIHFRVDSWTVTVYGAPWHSARLPSINWNN